jgi:hypothetical protein
MITQNFWVSVGLMTISLPLFWVMLFHVFDVQQRAKRICGLIVYLIIYGIVIRIIWIPLDVNIKLTYSQADFPLVKPVYGIKWNKSYSAIFVDMPNGGADATQIDAYLLVANSFIVDAGMSGGLNSCNWESSQQALFLGAATIKVTGFSGITEIPLQQDKWHSPILHIRCERLSANSQIEMVVALENSLLPGSPPAGKAHPPWAKLWISAMSGYRPVSWTKSACFIAKECDIPDLLPGQQPSFLFVFLDALGASLMNANSIGASL